MKPISYMAQVASEKIISNTDFRQLRIQLLADAGAALLVLLTTTVISIYKPWGKIGYTQLNALQPRRRTYSKSWGLYVLIGLIGLVLLLFAILHLTGVMGNHHH
jgi:hypothetical protein